MAYIAKEIQSLVNISLESPIDPNLLILDVYITQNTQFCIYNVYNELDQGNSGLYTLDRVLYPRVLKPNFVVLGDFNAYHL